MMKKLKKRMVKIKKSTRAFTLTELLVTIAIIAAVGSAAFFYLYNFKQVNALDQAAQGTIAAIRYAQNQAIAGDRGEKWGVHVEKDTNGKDYFAIYFGPTYSIGTTISRSPYSSGIAVKATEDVNFTQLSGTIPAKKTIVLQLASNPSINRVIIIDFTGIVTVSSNIPQWTISIADSDTNTGLFASLAVGSDGFARMSYYDLSNFSLKFTRCTNADCSAKNITTIDFQSSNPSVAFGSDGFPRISYFDDFNRDLKFARCLDADCTAKNIIIVDSAGYVGLNNSIVLGSDGFPRISYYDNTNFDLKLARCLNDDCTAKNITTIDSSGIVGLFTSLTLGSDGFARIGYYNGTNQDLKFARCTNADCATKNITTVDSGGDVGYYASMNLGSDGFARISYYDKTSGSLKFARCTDADCATRNITNVDSIGAMTYHPSSVLGPDGFVRISYYDTASGTIKFAECTNADCTAKNITTVDSIGAIPMVDFGYYSSIALGPDGFARISYYDAANQNFKFVKQNW